MKTLHTNSRRQFLIASGTTLTCMSVGAWIGTRYATSRSWVERVLRTNLPGIVLEEQSLAAFLQHIDAVEAGQSTLHHAVAFAADAAPSLVNAIPKIKKNEAIRERQVLTEFLVGSNFFRVDPTREPIVYQGAATACTNPFATFA